ncbi:hypothetical protein EDB92DRAFT_1885533 [Lactarius akahatsu]|uniref:Uncharacterized protein n=1 Tax=Lactarius akahatsu TaxID=416441 RepID=A0AAD4LCW5_9AGAM|nr:hypothetical protein EDB92DRAFT_1885533 [Lactarius akahatsu]
MTLHPFAPSPLSARFPKDMTVHGWQGLLVFLLFYTFALAVRYRVRRRFCLCALYVPDIDIERSPVMHASEPGSTWIPIRSAPS